MNDYANLMNTVLFLILNNQHVHIVLHTNTGP